MATEGEIEGGMRAFNISREEAATVSYIGDGVYASDDGSQIWLRTLEGHRIALDRHAWTALVNYHDTRRIERAK